MKDCLETAQRDTLTADNAEEVMTERPCDKDAKVEASFREIFEKALGLPPDAVECLIDIAQAFSTFDDVADEDPVTRQALDRTLWSTMVGLQMNPFYAANSAWLAPVISVAIMKWQTSDILERKGKADERTFVWRACYYDIVLLVVGIVHGWEVAANANVIGLYGETYAEYKKEFPDG